MEYQLVRHLNGYSGCSIKMMRDTFGQIFIRKTAKDINYNFRLIKQKNKQNQFVSSVFSSPQVLRDGYDQSGLYYFDMEFIIGVPMYQAIGNPAYNIVDIFSDKMEEHFQSYKIEFTNCQELFVKKIEEIEKNINFLSLAREFSILYSCADMLKAQSWQCMPTSPCHGDLTLENILVTQNNEIYLIDFLDSFVESLLMDCAKLLQDLELQWSLRHSPLKNQMSIDFIILKSKLLNSKFLKKYAEDKRQVYCLLLLNCLRIIPYIQDSEQKFIIAAIQHIYRYLKEIPNE